MPMQDLENLTVTTFSLQAFALHRTKLLRAFLEDFHLCAPITSPIHAGSTCTWTSPSQEEFTIDYVLIPQTWISNCHLSQIIEDFDLGNQQQDHSVHAVEL